MSTHAAAHQRTQEFVGLCQKHRLALGQAQNALEAGHPKIAEGVFRRAGEIQVQLEENVRGGQYSSLLSERAQLGQKLHAALAKNQTESARQLAGDLAALDKLIEAT